MREGHIAKFRGWEITLDPQYPPTVRLWGPDQERQWFSAYRDWRKNYTIAELIMRALTYIQEEELAKARARNEIAMARDLATHIIGDNLLTGDL